MGWTVEVKVTQGTCSETVLQMSQGTWTQTVPQVPQGIWAETAMQVPQGTWTETVTVSSSARKASEIPGRLGVPSSRPI